MKISKAHQIFADHLDNQNALEYPEPFLGPNWKDVLNFWLYLDTLSREDFDIVGKRYCALGRVDTLKSLTRKAARDNICYYYVYATAAWVVTPTLTCIPASVGVTCVYATLELIGSHNLETFTFLPLFLNP
jgi:hypothetical protein